MVDQATARFEGYWVTSPVEWEDERGYPNKVTALMFFDNGFFVRAIKTKKESGDEDEFEVAVDLLSYIVFKDYFETTPVTNKTSEADEDWDTYRWHITSQVQRPLVFEKDGASESFIPATLGILEEAGFPKKLFQAWQATADKRGWGFSSEARVPTVQT